MQIFNKNGSSSALPRAGETNSPASSGTATSTAEDLYLAGTNTPQTEMDLLFSGLNRSPSSAPPESIHVPGLEKDLFHKSATLSDSPIALTAIINKYKSLKHNLTERRSSLSHALEGYLRPEELMDLHARIDTLDRALLLVSQELTKALRQKERVDKDQLARAQENREQHAAEVASQEEALRAEQPDGIAAHPEPEHEEGPAPGLGVVRQA